MQISWPFKNDPVKVFPLIEAEDLVVYSKCLAPSALRNIKTKAQVFRLQGMCFYLFVWSGFFLIEKQDRRQRAGSTGWGGVLKSSGDDSVVRKKEKVSRPHSFLVLFLFFP